MLAFISQSTMWWLLLAIILTSMSYVHVVLVDDLQQTGPQGGEVSQRHGGQTQLGKRFRLVQNDAQFGQTGRISSASGRISASRTRDATNRVRAVLWYVRVRVEDGCGRVEGQRFGGGQRRFKGIDTVDKLISFNIAPWIIRFESHQKKLSASAASSGSSVPLRTGDRSISSTSCCDSSAGRCRMYSMASFSGMRVELTMPSPSVSWRMFR